MSESPYFIFCEKKKCRKNEKKISCVEKRREKKKKRVLFFREDNFRDIVRVKKKRKLVNDESYVSSSECYKSVEKFLPVVFEESVSEADMSNDS
jgi:hypothetical protein